MKTMHKFLAVVISAALTAGLLAGCGAASSTASGAASSEAVSSVAASSEAASSEAASGQAEDARVKAEFTVTGADGESQTFTLEVTDGEKLSDALVEAGLISEEATNSATWAKIIFPTFQRNMSGKRDSNSRP